MDFIVNWLAATPGHATPLLLAALGLIINERAGVLNLGSEGMMLCGALAGAMAALATGSPWPGLLAAAAGGAALAALFAVAVVIFRAEQVVTGLIMVALGAGITGLVGRHYTSQTLPGLRGMDLGPLGDLPILGPILFRQNAAVYLALVLTVTLALWLARSRAGLRMCAVGEDPAAADAIGLNVQRQRMLAVIAGGTLCGLGGGYLALVSSQVWVEGMTQGRGWIAVGLVIFARWRPSLALAGALLFGAIEAVIPRVQAVGGNVPVYLMTMLPYLATLAVLVVAGLRRRRDDEPAALGQPYLRQDRH
ncbi:MAG: ABC transporter permease [Alphaproteobacteria bacterium]